VVRLQFVQGKGRCMLPTPIRFPATYASLPRFTVRRVVILKVPVGSESDYRIYLPDS
jgi:hypothetical protein